MRSLALGVVVIATGCGPSTPPAPPKPDPSSMIGTQSTELAGKVAELRSEVDALKSELDRFNHYNWKDVVPDVKDAAYKIDDKLNDVEESFETLSVTAAEIQADYESAANDAEVVQHER